MATTAKQLASRIRELRRRHFGPRGKSAFAQQLGIPLDEYERFERGTVPPGEVMVRMCELTGEDLQWLLTGQASRGTVVISGARARHRDLLSRIAEALDKNPRLATPLEAFFDLLTAGEALRGARKLPAPDVRNLIPVFEAGHWPPEPPGPEGLPLAPTSAALPKDTAESCDMILSEPEPEPGVPVRDARLYRLQTADGGVSGYLYCPAVGELFPGAFALGVEDDSMSPLVRPGDVVVVAPEAEPQLGRLAACRFEEPAGERCRIWLGSDEEHVDLGRLGDGAHERLPKRSLRWALEVIYRATRQAA